LGSKLDLNLNLGSSCTITLLSTLRIVWWHLQEQKTKQKTKNKKQKTKNPSLSLGWFGTQAWIWVLLASLSYSQHWE
jgi:hypothetical protein